ncbi:MAG: methionyl-tRNA formyltransferase [Flavobacteriales bacterium]
MIDRRIIFLGSTKLSEEVLKHLIDKGINICAIFSIPEYFKISYSKDYVLNSNYSDLSIYSKELNIPYFEVDSEDGKRLQNYSNEIIDLKPDVILAIGWYYMVPKIIREIPTEGVWGIHASLLPDYAGGAPLVWAMINGEKHTGITLFRMDSGVDTGDIIEQKKIVIEEDDTIKSMLLKVSKSSKMLINRALKNSKTLYKPQDKSKIKVYPQRSPKDGKINWSWSKRQIENFVRAQTKPYPGAWTIIENKKIIIWDVSIEELKDN